jgi:hypothetical protein
LRIKNVSSSHPLQPLGTGAYDEHDWALLELPTNYCGVNEIRHPASETKHIVISVSRSIMPNNALLYVVTKRGLINAYSIAGSGTSINFFGSKVSQKVWAIQLTKLLGK